MAHLMDVSVRSLLLALAASIAMWLAGRRRTAAGQHAIWTAVVCGMLALFAFGQALPRMPLRILGSPEVPVAANAVAPAMPVTPSEGFSGVPRPQSPVPAKFRRPVDWANVVLCLYGVIAFAFFARFVTGLFLIRKLRATADPVHCASGNAVYESDRLTVPVSVGWLRPRILLPLEWRDWTQRSGNNSGSN